MENTSLLPCPFCGSPPEEKADGDVMCSNIECDCCLSSAEQWNTRHTPAALSEDEAVEVMAAAINSYEQDSYNLGSGKLHPNEKPSDTGFMADARSAYRAILPHIQAKQSAPEQADWNLANQRRACAGQPLLTLTTPSESLELVRMLREALFNIFTNASDCFPSIHKNGDAWIASRSKEIAEPALTAADNFLGRNA